MVSRRYFANAAPQQTLANSITNSATSLTVASSFSGWPTQFPFFAILDYGNSSMEIVSVTNIVGTTATIVRGQNGTIAVSHPSGATIDQGAVAQDLDEANAHTSASTGVHGVAGAVVGTTDTQTLTNKTLTSPTVNSPTVSNPTVTGTVSNTATNNLTGAGTALAVTNNATFGSETVTGTSTLHNVTVSNGAVITGDPSAGNALGLIPGKASSFGLYVRDSTNSSNVLTVSDAGNLAASGNLSANGNVSGAEVSASKDIKVPAYANAAARDAAITSPTNGMLVYLTSPGLFSQFMQGTWKTIIPSDNITTLSFTPAGNTDTPTSGTATWVSLGNVNVPAWATQALVMYTMNGIFDTGTTTTNVAVQLKIGAAAGSLNKRIMAPGVANQRFYVPVVDFVSGLSTGLQTVTLFATWAAGATVIRADTQSYFTINIQFVP